MSKFKDIVLGALLIVIGLIVGLNAFEITKIDIFFDGWWTLFIIVPCFIGVFENNDKTGNFIGLLIGILLLLCCQGLFSFDLLWKLLLPSILVIAGLSIIFKNTLNSKISEKINKLNKDKKDNVCNAIFSSQKISFKKEKYNGSDICAVFGGIDIDLRDSIIDKDIVINAICIFGGADIFVPKDINVIINSTSIFGGTENKIKNNDKEYKHTIYINSTCIFGGLEIK